MKNQTLSQRDRNLVVLGYCSRWHDAGTWGVCADGVDDVSSFFGGVDVHEALPPCIWLWLDTESTSDHSIAGSVSCRDYWPYERCIVRGYDRVYWAEDGGGAYLVFWL